MAAEMEEVLASVWPDWKIIEPISAGESATVYKARRHDMAGTSDAAIKVTVIPSDINEIDDLRASGLTEEAVQLHLEQALRKYTASIHLMKKVKGYTNIVSIDDYKVVHHDKTGQWFVIERMELLMPLHKRLQLAPFTEEDIIRLGIDLCNALDVCSRKNIVHKNIKPENIFINSSGDYKLGNFGLARNVKQMELESHAINQPNYMAPEVYMSLKHSIDFEAYARMDIYSLGLVMYYLSNNRKMPFIPQEKQIIPPKERREAFNRRINGDHLPGLPRVSRQLESIILKACAFHMEERYTSAGEMRDDLMALQKQGKSGMLQREEDDVPGGAQDSPASQRAASAHPMHVPLQEVSSKKAAAGRKHRRMAGIVVGVVLVALLAILLTVGFIRLNQRTSDAETATAPAQAISTACETCNMSAPGSMRESGAGNNGISCQTANRPASLSHPISAKALSGPEGSMEVRFIPQDTRSKTQMT